SARSQLGVLPLSLPSDFSASLYSRSSWRSVRLAAIHSASARVARKPTAPTARAITSASVLTGVVQREARLSECIGYREPCLLEARGHDRDAMTSHPRLRRRERDYLKTVFGRDALLVSRAIEEVEE